jgi:hypothetical protein
MADNFVRKTFTNSNKLPNVQFYDIGDIVILKSGAFHVCTYFNNKKSFVQLSSNIDINNILSRLTKLETTVADHEKRIKALEAPTT